MSAVQRSAETGRPAPDGRVPVPLLLVEDDRELTDLLGRVLADEGYAVTTATDGQRGLHLALTRRFSVMVVDRGLPGMEGLDLVTRLRDRGVVTPMLVLSARGSILDRVAGLDAGAEDYLPKPFDVTELLARLRALLRRHVEHSSILPVPGGHLDVPARTIQLVDGSLVSLSARETALLALLAARPAQVFSRSDLLALVFGDAESPNAVDTYVHYCRRKLGAHVISTVRGLGYRLGAT